MNSEQDAIFALQGWVDRFERTLNSSKPESVAEVFTDDGYWRDVLAFTWLYKTYTGRAEIGEAFKKYTAIVKPRDFQIDPTYPVSRKPFLDREVLEGMVTFRTEQAVCSAVIRLVEDGQGDAKAWLVITLMDELIGHEERIGERRQRNTPSLSSINGENWFDQRKRAVAYEDREPTVLVVGAGQSGLSLAARLTVLGVDTLVVEREPRIGDNWRNRYYQMTLHNEIVANDLPYMPFPPNWPYYIPKDKLGDWLESYAAAMEINNWTSTDFEGATYDDKAGRWTATVVRNGKKRVLHPRHIVMAVGVSGEPNRIKIDGIEKFKGEVIHSADYKDRFGYEGKNVMVFGTGNSAHDIAQDLAGAAASVTMVQKSVTMVISCEPTAQAGMAIYKQGLTVEQVDKACFLPYQVFVDTSIAGTKDAMEQDRHLVEGLEKAGFRTYYGPDNKGTTYLYYQRGGGYYFNVGCSDLIIEGKIGLIQFSDIKDFAPTGPVLQDGKILPTDAMVLATGYLPVEDVMREKFGPEVMKAIGPIWRFDAEGELNNMFIRTAQPGLYFQAGGLPHARLWSKPLALQIKAIEEGILTPDLEVEQLPVAAE